MRAFSWSFLLACSLAIGCSSSGNDAADVDASSDATDAISDATDTKKPPPPSDAEDDTTETRADAGCNGLFNVALAVTENNVAANLPIGGGGLIADGIYVVTAVTRYNGPAGKVGPGFRTIEETISITGGSVQGVRKVNTDLGYGYNAGIAPTGGSLLWKQTCPSGEPGVTYDFSTGDQTFDVYDKVQKIGTTYTRKNLKP